MDFKAGRHMGGAQMDLKAGRHMGGAKVVRFVFDAWSYI